MYFLKFFLIFFLFSGPLKLISVCGGQWSQCHSSNGSLCYIYTGGPCYIWKQYLVLQKGKENLFRKILRIIFLQWKSQHMTKQHGQLGENNIQLSHLTCSIFFQNFKITSTLLNSVCLSVLTSYLWLTTTPEIYSMVLTLRHLLCTLYLLFFPPMLSLYTTLSHFTFLNYLFGISLWTLNPFCTTHTLARLINPPKPFSVL